jgi:myo-inositol-1(or 4)-monophosphatase
MDRAQMTQGRGKKSELIEVMVAAALAAGEGLKADFAAIAGLHVHHKAGIDDKFTEADLRAERTVRDMLASYRSDYGFLGEEGGLVEGSDQANVWIVDPLDGTANFLIGLPLFAVNVALARDGQVVAGVTHVPLLGETFWAERGKGAYLNDSPIRVSVRRDMIEAVLAVGIPFASKPRHDQFAAEMLRITPRVSGLRRLGAAAVDMAYVACGRFDADWEQAVCAWDIAAGVIIVQEAGGTVTDSRGRALVLDNGTILASTPQLHPELVALLTPVNE